MRREVFFAATIVILLLLSACTASEPEQPLDTITTQEEPAVEQAAESETDASSGDVTESEQPSGQQETEMEDQNEMVDQSEEMADGSDQDSSMSVDRPAWQKLALTNARTGETFTLADFEGKTVFVEPMATWCSNCRRQLNNVLEAKQQLASDDVVFVALSVETSIDDATLANYADGAGFDRLFAVLSPERLGQLADEFGRSIATPPATPHFIIRADGTHTDLVTGVEPAGQIAAQILAQG